MKEHDQQDARPTWFKEQPHSPVGVYGAEAVRDIQRTLQVPETGVWDLATVSHVKGLQHVFDLPATGIIDLNTAIQIERLRNRYAVRVRETEEVSALPEA